MKFRYMKQPNVVLIQFKVNTGKFKHIEIVLFSLTTKGFVEIADILIKYGANVNAPDDHKNTPLHFIGRIDNVDKQYAMAELLVNNFADTDAKNDNDKTPFEMTRCQKSMFAMKVINFLPFFTFFFFYCSNVEKKVSHKLILR